MRSTNPLMSLKWVTRCLASSRLGIKTNDLVPTVHNFFLSSQRLHKNDCQNCIHNLEVSKQSSHEF